MIYPSPLRYPGGKKKLAGYIADVILQNDVQGGTYVEPYAGGANVALCLLFSEIVNAVIINDIDRSIYAFWHSVLYDTEKFCQMINDTEISINEWNKQREMQRNKDEVDLINLGFSTFFLNRTNRSGIIRGGVIGGKTQTGEWKMDVRYNKEDLIKRIRKIARYEGRIQLYNRDAVDFINYVHPQLDDNTLVYFDPPYYNKGSALYANFYTHDDHRALSEFIQGLNCKWILTYDYTPEVVELYRNVEKRLLTLSYTAMNKEKGNEMIAFSDGLRIPIGKYSSVTIE
jgi:DNA adenine methylase